MILERFYPFTKQLKWLLIAALLLTTISIGYQPLRIMFEQQRLFYQIDQMARNTRQDEDSTRPFDPWQDLVPLTTPEGRAAAQQALIEAQHLVAVTPYNTEAFRHLGRAAILAGRPDIAIYAFSRAVEQRPNSPLIWFELGIAYEQLAPVRMLKALTTSLLDGSDRAWLPPQPTRQKWSLPVRAMPSNWWVPTEISRTVVTSDQMALSLTLPIEPALLSFWMGTLTSQPAVYRVILDGEVIGTFELSASAQGWHHGYIDLAPWAGQAVVITLQTDSSVAGLGDLRIIDQAAIECISVDCLQRAVAAWRKGGFSADDFLHAGTVAFRQKQYDDALRWFERAAMFDVDVVSVIFYIQYLLRNDIDELANSVTIDSGWPDNFIRMRAWSAWGKVLLSQNQSLESERVFRKLIEMNEAAPDWFLSDVYRDIGLSLWRQQRLQEALPYFSKAISLNPRNVAAHFDYGKVLYLIDPENITQTEQSFIVGIEIHPHPKNWAKIINFWERVKKPEYKARWCERARMNGLNSEALSDC